MEITKQDLLEYKQEVKNARETILTSKDEGMKTIEEQVREYKEKLVDEFNAQVQKELDKCDIEENVLDKLIAKQEKEEEVL